MTYAWGNLIRLPITGPKASALQRSAIITVLLFGVAVVVFAAFTIGVEVALGHPLQSATAPGYSPSLLDAVWHLATAFVLVLPARRWAALWLAPVLALGIDADHIFGDVLPTVTGRTDHNLFFLVLIGALLYFLQGRSASFLALGAVLAHIAVDGGRFPLFGPVSVSLITIPLPILLALLPVASVLFYLAGRDVRELTRTSQIAQIAVVSFAVGAVFVFLPALATFVTQ